MSFYLILSRRHFAKHPQKPSSESNKMKLRHSLEPFFLATTIGIWIWYFPCNDYRNLKMIFIWQWLSEYQNLRLNHLGFLGQPELFLGSDRSPLHYNTPLLVQQTVKTTIILWSVRLMHSSCHIFMCLCFRKQESQQGPLCCGKVATRVSSAGWRWTASIILCIVYPYIQVTSSPLTYDPK